MARSEPDMSGLVFLLVEDYPFERRLLADALMMRNASVLLSDSYESCRELLARGAVFDLMILDMELRNPREWDWLFTDDHTSLSVSEARPNHTGDEILEYIVENRIRARVVVWSAHLSNPSYAAKLARYGVAGYFKKPNHVVNKPLDVYEEMDQSDFVLINALARAGRHVCDEHNTHAIAEAEEQARIRLNGLRRKLQELTYADSEDARKFAREMLAKIGDIPPVPFHGWTRNAFSWRFFVVELGKFLNDVVPATIAEILKRYLL